MTDRELIRQAHTGNKDALNEIVNRYYDDIYKFCCYLTANETDSYDISQEVFLRFIKYIDSYNDKNLKGYLLITARNLCRDYFRRKESERYDKLSENIQREDNIIGNIESELFLNAILKQLPIEQREVVVLRIREKLKFKEIAHISGSTLSTVKSRYRLGIEKLRKEMTGYEGR